MCNFTQEEKLGLFKRGLQRRLIGKNKAIEEREKNITRLAEMREGIVKRIEKYKDDDYIVKMLNSQLTQFDREYSGTKQQFVNAIEEIKETEPIVKELLADIHNIEKGNSAEVEVDKFLDIILDLFFKAMLTDWKEMETQNEKESKEVN